MWTGTWSTLPDTTPGEPMAAPLAPLSATVVPALASSRPPAAAEAAMTLVITFLLRGSAVTTADRTGLNESGASKPRIRHFDHSFSLAHTPNWLSRDTYSEYREKCFPLMLISSRKGCASAVNCDGIPVHSGADAGPPSRGRPSSLSMADRSGAVTKL